MKYSLLPPKKHEEGRVHFGLHFRVAVSHGGEVKASEHEAAVPTAASGRDRLASEHEAAAPTAASSRDRLASGA